MQDNSRKFVEALDDATEQLLTAGDPPRYHLGPSSLSGSCAREAWYSFRRALQPKVGGRMKRLWNRGHDEEHRVVRWLRATGVEVRDYRQRLLYAYDRAEGHSYQLVDWDADWKQFFNWYNDVHDDPLHISVATDLGEGPKQWGFVDEQTAHLKGSSDGRLRGVEEWFPEVAGYGWGLFENKTHAEKYFRDLVRKGLKAAMPSHYNQMQTYMGKHGLSWGLYVAVNKNDDDIHVEIVWHASEVSEFRIDLGRKVIAAREAPPRAAEDPSWFVCRMCDYRGVCHYDEPVAKSCTSCIFATAEPDGSWRCGVHRATIPQDFLDQGCDKWEPIK